MAHLLSISEGNARGALQGIITLYSGLREVVETYDEESRKQESWGFGELKLAEEFMTRKWKEGYLCRIDCPSVSVIGDGTVVDKLAVQLQLLDGEV